MAFKSWHWIGFFLVSTSVFFLIKALPVLTTHSNMTGEARGFRTSIDTAILSLALSVRWGRRSSEQGQLFGWLLVDAIHWIMLKASPSEWINSSFVSQFDLKQYQLFPFVLITAVFNSLETIEC